MSEQKVLGKIKNIDVGLREGKFGINVELTTTDGNVQEFHGTWAEFPERAQYPKADWETSHAKAYEWLRSIMKDANATSLSEMKNKPVEVAFKSGILFSWRILTEVL